ncbi:MAG: hypothetical protein HRT43_01390 [Campylobacteraceae bacterium]|nr:hypothetical protein [Campylobacteraceae bacterium]
MKYIKKISNYAMVGGLGAMLIVGLVGCEDKGQQQKADALNQGQKNGAFVIIEQTEAGGYTIVDEFPSKDTRIVLRQADGTERILSQREIDILVQEENIKIENGTSALTNPEQAQMSGGGMGLGGVLMSSIAGAMIGSYIGGKLFNNQNYKNQRAAQYKSPSTYSRSKNSFAKAKAASARSAASKKSGFFGGGKKSTAKRSFFGG